MIYYGKSHNNVVICWDVTSQIQIVIIFKMKLSRERIARLTSTADEKIAKDCCRTIVMFERCSSLPFRHLINFLYLCMADSILTNKSGFNTQLVWVQVYIAWGHEPFHHKLFVGPFDKHQFPVLSCVWFSEKPANIAMAKKHVHQKGSHMKQWTDCEDILPPILHILRQYSSLDIFTKN